MKFFRKFLPLFVAFGVILNLSSAYAIGISARGGFVLNANTCEEVYSYQGDTPMVPASMTKVMAAYVIYDAMAQGQISKDTMIPVGSALAAYSRDPGYSNVYLSAGASYSLDELLGAIFVVSANAAVMAVGDYLYGSEAAFVARMNQFVSDWGIDAYFQDCSGVSSSNRVTPRAMATIANRLVSDYPDCLNYSSLTSLNFRGQTYYATNKMLPGRGYDYDGTMGLKTGTTSAAGACFTGVVERDGVRMISVIMGAPYSNGRYTDSITMLDYAFSQASSQPQAQPEPAPVPTATPAPEPPREYVSMAVPDATAAPVRTTAPKPARTEKPAPSAPAAPIPSATAVPAPAVTPSPTAEPAPVTPSAPAAFPDSPVHVNDLPIPGFVNGSDRAMQLVRVEDLRENGFEVTYEAETNTLVVVNAPAKQLTGHNPADFPAELTVWNRKPVNVLLKQNDSDLGIYTAEVYDAEGQAAIDVQELAYLGWVIQKDGKATIVTRS